jgi:putative glutamine amidotransferase
MHLPVIGVTSGTLFDDHTDSPQSFFSRYNYTNAIAAAGGGAFVIPPLEQEELLHAMYSRLDGIILAGGEDIDPRYYNEAPHESVKHIDHVRDHAELWLTRKALEDGKPLLGICRGIQVLNVAMGGTLYQDIPSQYDSDINHNASKAHTEWDYLAHTLRLDPQSRLANILGTDDLPINTAHHQAVRHLAPGLRATGWSPDGLIEAGEGTNGSFVLAVQCHPEALFAAIDTRWRALFAAFVDAAGTRR